MDKNDVYLRPTASSVYVGDCCRFRYISVRRCTNVSAATILRVPRQVCLLPGDTIELPVPSEYREDYVCVEPRVESPGNKWVKCGIYKNTKGIISIENESSTPVIVKRHEQLCQIRPVGIAPSKESPCPPVKRVFNDKYKDRSGEVIVDQGGCCLRKSVGAFTMHISVSTPYFHHQWGVITENQVILGIKLIWRHPFPPKEKVGYPYITDLIWRNYKLNLMSFMPRG